MPTRRQLKETKRQAKLLKKAGLIEYDLRRTLTPAQRGRITKLWKGPKDKETGRRTQGWKPILDSGEYVFRTVNKKRIRQFDELGYRTAKKRIYIHARGFDKVHIKGNKIVKSKPGKQTEDLLIPPENFLKELEARVGTPRKKGEFLTVRIGDREPFSKSFVSYQSLLQYIEKWKPHDKFADREALINQMSIVRFNR